jgi:hypothetical protein
VNLWEQLERGSAPPPAREGTLHHGYRAAVAFALALLTYLLFPAAPAAEFPLLEVGTVATEDVIAPFAFRVPKSPDELERERAAAAGAALPVRITWRDFKGVLHQEALRLAPGYHTVVLAASQGGNQ